MQTNNTILHKNKKTHKIMSYFLNGVSYAIRTHDPLIKSQVLYRLS